MGTGDGVPILDTYVAGNVREGETQWDGNGKLFRGARGRERERREFP